MPGHRLGHALAALEAGLHEVPGIALVDRRARRAADLPAVTAGLEHDVVGTGSAREHRRALPGRRIEHPPFAEEPHRPAAPATGLALFDERHEFAGRSAALQCFDDVGIDVHGPILPTRCDESSAQFDAQLQRFGTQRLPADSDGCQRLPTDTPEFLFEIPGPARRASPPSGARPGAVCAQSG